MTGAEFYLPIVFMAVMGIAMLAYAVLDGYDLGVGMLFAGADDDERNVMLASIGPFWDANETWLVMGVGVLLIAFPMAHGAILTALYLPVMLMLVGLILRGVAFDFRAKAHAGHKRRWDIAFCIGSLMASFAQGFMLGQYIIGFGYAPEQVLFSMLIGLCVCAGYILIGACWLILKTEGDLQKRAIRWARRAWLGTGVGILLVSASTPLVSPRIFEKWFSLQNMIGLLPIPIITAALFFAMLWVLKRLPFKDDQYAWTPFALVVGMFMLCFNGLAYSFYPYIVPEKMTIWEAASAVESLWVILAGALLVLPMIAGYTFFAYRVFGGKVRELHYD